MAHKDVDRLDLPKGYTLKLSGTQHLTVICPDGEPLRMPNGVPVTCALTPGTDRTRTIEASRIRRALRGDADVPTRGAEVDEQEVAEPEAKRDKPPRSASRRRQKAKLGGKVRFAPLPVAAEAAPTRRTVTFDSLCHVERRYQAAVTMAGMTSFERDMFALWRAMRRRGISPWSSRTAGW